MYANVKSLCSPPDTNIVYVNYISVKKEKKKTVTNTHNTHHQRPSNYTYHSIV